MAHKLFLLNFFILPFFFATCNSLEPPPPEKTITLTLEDISCIEAWINLTSTNLQLPATLTLKQNNHTRTTINLDKTDTLLYIDSLLPNQTYSFLATMHPSNHTNEVKSNVLSVATPDTTSHNFNWQSWTFGEHSSSTLYDVAIINENNIWAVGEIYMNDSLGNPDPTFYNAAHWNGQEWELKKIFYEGGIWTIRTIFAFNENDVWFSAFVKYDGHNFIELPIPPILTGWSINKIWGSSSNDLYVVGNNGNIAYYNGTSWQKIESGTETRINDVWGIISDDNKTILYCPVSSFFVQGDKKILKIVDGKVDSVSWNRDIRLYSTWAVNENFLYVCGEGVYESKFGVWNEINLYPVGTNSIRGTDINNIFIVGDYGVIFHFNGIRWQMLSTPSNKGYSKVTIKNNIVTICGNFQGKGLIEIGSRN